jgi:hypothetical protein
MAIVPVAPIEISGHLAWRLAEALSSAGLVALEQGRLERAYQAFTEGLRTTRSWTVPTVLEGLANVAV